jgi:hypothetical protein
MKAICTFALVFALAACAAPQPPLADESFEGDQADRTAGPAQDCVLAGSGAASLSIVARGVVGYRSGATLWVNRLPEACAYMQPPDTLAIEVHGGQYCRGDRVSAVGPGGSIPGPTCILGRFTPYRERAK